MTATQRVAGFVRHQWPWLLVALAAIGCGSAVAAVVVILTADPGPTSLPSSGGPSPSGSPPSTAPTAPAPTAQPPAKALPDATAGMVGGSRSGWADVARGFGQTFTRTTLGQDAWFAAVSSWLTDDQAAMYREVEVTTIPAGTLQDVDVDDPGRSTRTRGLLTYDTGMQLDVGLVYAESAGGWLIASVHLVDSTG